MAESQQINTMRMTTVVCVCTPTPSQLHSKTRQLKPLVKGHSQKHLHHFPSHQCYQVAWHRVSHTSHSSLLRGSQVQRDSGIWREGRQAVCIFQVFLSSKKNWQRQYLLPPKANCQALSPAHVLWWGSLLSLNQALQRSATKPCLFYQLTSSSVLKSGLIGVSSFINYTQLQIQSSKSSDYIQAVTAEGHFRGTKDACSFGEQSGSHAVTYSLGSGWHNKGKYNMCYSVTFWPQSCSVSDSPCTAPWPSWP